MHALPESPDILLASPRPQDHAVTTLTWMLFLIPALGVPSELMLQDTLKSALVAFGVLIAALVYFWQQRQRTTPLQWHGLVWLPLALMVYALGCMAWSHTYLAGVEAVRWFILSLLLWLGLNTLTRENLPTLVWGIHLGAVVASVWVALQFWFDWRFFPQAAAPASTFINRNFFAEYAVGVLPLSVWLLARMRPSRWLAAMTISIALNVVALMMTGTRSALVALIVMAPVLTVIIAKYRNILPFWPLAHVHKALIAILFILCIGVMGSIPTHNEQLIKGGGGTTAMERSFLRTASMMTLKEYADGTFSVRSTLWKATARMMLANPLTGVGAGAWEVQIPLYQRNDTVLEVDYYAHNEFLQLLSEYGMLVGGMVLAVLWAYLLKAVGTTWQLRDEDQQEAPLRAFTLTSLLALMIVSSAGFPWHLAGCGALLALGLAILAGSDARLCQQAPFYAVSLRWRPVYTQVALVFLLASLGTAGYVAWKAAQAERKIVHAIHLSFFLTQSLPANLPSAADRKTEMLRDIRDGITINPHYRKLSTLVSERLSSAGDWGNAVWILESVAASRPHVVAIWYALAIGYSKLGQHQQALQALHQVQRLKPNDTSTLTLEINLLSNSGHEDEAKQLLTRYYDQRRYDYDMLQAGYAIGLKTHEWALAIRSLDLRNLAWPEQAADGYFRLGQMYADPALRDDAKALAAFKAGLAAVSTEQKENYRSQVPRIYRALM